MRHRHKLVEFLVNDNDDYQHGILKKRAEKLPHPSDPNEAKVCKKCGDLMPPGIKGSFCPDCKEPEPEDDQDSIFLKWK